MRVGLVSMIEPLQTLPPAVANEYSGLRAIRHAPTAFVYGAQDGVGDRVVISEIFVESLCHRNSDGAVSAQPEQEDAWGELLARTDRQVADWSRLSHPALHGIDQVFRTNGTLYVVTREIAGRSLNRISETGEVDLTPAEAQLAVERLIDLFAYLQAFGATGLKISPEAVVFEDEDATVSLAIEKNLAGSQITSGIVENSISDQRRALADTLHFLLTGQAAGRPHKPLAGRLPGIDASLVSTIDKMLAAGEVPEDADARAWKARIRAPSGSRGTPRWRLAGVAVGAALALCAAVWVSVPYWNKQEVSTEARSPGLTVPDAGAWQLELPLQVVGTALPERPFVLRVTDASRDFIALNPWVAEGLRVTEINGAAVEAPVDLRNLVLASDASLETVELTSLTVSDPDLPLQRNVAVIPYLWREKTYGAVVLREQATVDGWQISVSDVKVGATLPLKAGDVLIHEQVADAALSRFSDFDALLAGLDGKLNTSLTLLIRREDDTRLVVGFAAERLLETASTQTDE